MQRTRQFHILYHGTDDIECIKAEGFSGSRLNEGIGRPVYAVFLTEDITKARRWGKTVIKVHLEGIPTYWFYEHGWHYYAEADELNARSRWEVIE